MTTPSVPSMKGKGLHMLLWELSDNEEDAAMDTGVDIPHDPQWPWFHDFCAYMGVSEQVPEGWMAIQWWGVSLLVSISWQGTNKNFTVQLTALTSGLEVPCMWLSGSHVIIHLQQACIFTGWNHNIKALQPSQGWHCGGSAVHQMWDPA